jgi:eukaryotic-like serine/threonine-protein kinase
MDKHSTPQNDVIQFLRKRDYILVEELGQGSCGKTVLLKNPQIDELLVCKKYVPYSESLRQELFTGFIREIKLLHKINHPNIVRVSNYYLYPDKFTGFILMEYVKGTHVDDYLNQQPERTNEVFQSAVAGFAYLECTGILHRDIRPANIMVREDGTLKIIDLGFGKQVNESKDFEKSISLNWWCPPPDEFGQSRYDFSTEVYFVGKLFESIIQSHDIGNFQYPDIIRRMCQKDPLARLSSFTEIQKEIGNNQFIEAPFADAERDAYREFADSLCKQISKLETGARYISDIGRIITNLDDACRNFILEHEVPDAAIVLRCFLTGTYYYKKKGLWVAPVTRFLRLLKACSKDKNRLLLANLQTRFDALPHYIKHELTADDVPF